MIAEFDERNKLMKKFIPAITIVIFPYAIAFVLYCIFSGFLMESLFQNNVYLCLLALLVLWGTSLICSITICAVSIIRKWDFMELSRINMIIKIVLIPAYIVIFAVGTICMLTIFTYLISLVLMILDGMAIILSGIFGFSAIKRSYDNNAISLNEMVIHSFFQFIFCADVISSIIVYRKAKSEFKRCKLQNNDPIN